MALIDDPHIADLYFGIRVEGFTPVYFDGLINAERKCFHDEYQGRESRRTRGCVTVGNDPGIVDLTCEAECEKEGRCAQLGAAVG